MHFWKTTCSKCHIHFLHLLPVFVLFYKTLSFSFFRLWNHLISPILECTLICFELKWRCGNEHFDIHLWRVNSFHFLLKKSKDLSYGGLDSWRGVQLPPESAFELWYPFVKVLSSFQTLTWRVNIYVCHQGNDKIGSSAGTKTQKSSTDDLKQYLIPWKLDFCILPTFTNK